MIISEKLNTKADLSNRNLTDRIDQANFGNMAQISDTMHACMTRSLWIAMERLSNTLVDQSRSLHVNITRQPFYNMRYKYDAGEAVQQQWW